MSILINWSVILAATVPLTEKAPQEGELAVVGAITSGTCMKDDKAIGAVTKEQCKDDGGTWHATKVSTVQGVETETSGGAPKK